MGTSVDGVRGSDLVLEFGAMHILPREDACLYRVNGAVFHPN